MIEASTGTKGVTGPASVELETACRTLAVQARTAARRMALARGSAKNDWLARAAAALRARSAEILEANARDVAAAPGLGLNAAAVDRLSLDARRIDELAGSLLASPRSARSHRRGRQRQPAAQWAGGQPGPRSAGRHLHDLREPAQRDRGCRGALRQERQRGHPPRRQGSHPLQPRPAPHPGR